MYDQRGDGNDASNHHDSRVMKFCTKKGENEQVANQCPSGQENGKVCPALQPHTILDLPEEKPQSRCPFSTELPQAQYGSETENPWPATILSFLENALHSNDGEIQ